MSVFVIDSNKQPCAPCTERRARKLLSLGKAAVWLRYPFTLILKSASEAKSPPLDLRIDPGSKFTGFAIVNPVTGQAVHCMELQHRGQKISMDMTSRAALRRGRRARKTRYRPSRFNNRASMRAKGRLSPSIQHRVLTTLSWVKKYMRLCPISSIQFEAVRFDLQKLENPEISGVEYQQGELLGHEVKEYVLLKFDHTCAYCSKKGVPLNVDHVVPRSKGGSNRVSNLVAACIPCNDKKDNLPLEQFAKPEVVERIKRQLKAPLKDAAAVNSTRHAIERELRLLGLPVHGWSGGRTKFNRKNAGFPKTHCYDAAVVGDNPARSVPKVWLAAKCMGRGNRQMVANDKYGFPRKQAARRRGKAIHGFCAGDIVKSPVGIGRVVSARTTGNFTLKVGEGNKSLTPKKLKLVQHGNGYSFSTGCADFLKRDNT